MKNYIGFARDHSGSMASIATYAKKDYNDNIAAIREAAIAEKQDTIVSVVTFGNRVVREVTNSSVHALKPLDSYGSHMGMTALWDSVGELIDIFKKVPDVNDKNTSFLLMITTDGEENASVNWNASSISQEIKRLQATDRWTFVFRVPRGQKYRLTSFGIHEGNILEWDQTREGVAMASVATRSAVTAYYADRTKGLTSSKTFFADLSNVKASQVKANMTDISKEIDIWTVPAADDDIQIRAFVEQHVGDGQYQKGAAFYQLTKLERQVQDYKLIAIKHKKTGKAYAGVAARQLLGLPTSGTIKLQPGPNDEYYIFIQSTSVNRKLPAGSRVLYWTKHSHAY